MQRKFLVNLFLFLGLNLLIKPFWIFGIDRSVQNTVGENVYGMYFVLFNFSLLFNMLLDFGVTSLNNRNIARSSNFLRENFSRIFTLKLILGLFYIVCVLIAGLSSGYTISHFELLFFLIINQFLAGFILFLRSNVSGLLLFKTDSFLSIIDRLIMIICCSILLWGGVVKTPFQIEWFVYVQTFAYLATVFIALPVVLSHTRLKSPFVDYAYFKKILKQSLPFALLALFTGLHNRIDSVFLERLLPDNIGASQAGIYASAFRLLDAAMIIAYLFSVLLLPMFSNMIAKKESIVGLLKTASSLIFIFGIVVAVASFFYSYQLMNLLYHNHIEQSAAVFRILMLSIAPLSATYIFGSLLTAKGELKKLNTIALIAIAINTGLNFLLIFKWQAVGSAVASLCTQFFIIAAEIVLAVKLFKIKVSKIYCFKWIGFVFFAVFAGKISLYFPFKWQFQFLFLLIFLSIASIALEWKQVKYLIMKIIEDRKN
ncbi:MAG: oligosaccharide flippase family protein [Lentimicrobiaceae bacterium]|nr:oligosaccharide flippase family protein [Lentimicrobiaceae bacterium]